MSVQLTPEEMQAIVELASSTAAGAVPAGDVAERDFAQPTRLGPKHLQRVSAKLWGGVKDANRRFSSSLRGQSSLELVSVTETSGDGVTQGLAAPLAAGRFEVDGQIGWVFWSTKNAIAAIEIALGSEPAEEVEERPFSYIERVVLARILSPVIQAIGDPLGIQPSEVHVATEIEELGSWRDAEKADMQRLEIVLATNELPEETSLRILYPGVTTEHFNDGDDNEVGALPDHLHNVPVAVSAALGSCSFSLRELLEIEIGDVLPLGLPAGSPIQLTAEDRPFATARLGSRQGNLAARIETLSDRSSRD